MDWNDLISSIIVRVLVILTNGFIIWLFWSSLMNAFNGINDIGYWTAVGLAVLADTIFDHKHYGVKK